MGPTERLLRDELNLSIERDPFVGADPGVDACIVARPVGDLGTQFRLLVRDSLTDDLVEVAAEWFAGLVERFHDGGIQSDAWQTTSWNGYQLWGRFHRMPSLEG